MATPQQTRDTLAEIERQKTELINSINNSTSSNNQLLISLIDEVRKSNLKTFSELEKQIKRLGKDDSGVIDALKNVSDQYGILSELIDNKLQKSKSAFNSSIASLSSIYKSFGDEWQQLIDNSYNQISSLASQNPSAILDPTYSASVIDDVSSLFKIQKDIAELSSEDEDKRTELTEFYNNLSEKLKFELETRRQNGFMLQQEYNLYDGLISRSDRLLRTAQEYGSVHSSIKQNMQESYAELESYTSGVKKFTTMLNAGLKSPIGRLALLVKMIKSVKDSLLQVYSQTGYLLPGIAALGAVFKDATEVYKEMVHLAGDMEEVTLKSQLNVQLMAKGLGASAVDVAKISAFFGKFTGNTESVGQDMVNTLGAMARNSGVLTSDVVADLAANAKHFALYTDKSGKNIAKAVVYARRLGTDISSLDTVASGLLDFQKMISGQAELSAMMGGRQIDFSIAAQYSYMGEHEKMMDEVMNQIGGFEVWKNADPILRAQIASTLGLSPETFQAMAANWDKNKSKIEENTGILGGFTETFRGILVVAGEYADTITAALGTMGEWTKPFDDVIEGAGKVKESINGIRDAGSTIKNVFSNLKSGNLKGAFSAAFDDKDEDGGGGNDTAPLSNIDRNTLKSLGKYGKDAGKGLKSLSTGLKSMGTPRAFIGSAALGIAGIGFKLFNMGRAGINVIVRNGKKLGSGLKELAKGLSEMGTGKVLFGSLNLAIAGAGFLVTSIGTPGFYVIAKYGKKAGDGLVSLGKGLSTMGTGKVLLGSVALAAAGVGFLLSSVGVIGMIGIATFGTKAGTALISLAAGLSAMGTANVLLGSLGLIAAGIGFALLTIGSIGMLAVATLGEAAAVGLLALAGALSTLGGAFALILLGTIALIAFAGAVTLLSYGLSLLAPLVESVGNAISKIITSIADGITSIIASIGKFIETISSATTSDGIFALAGAFTSLAVSMGSFAGASLLAAPGLAAVSAVSKIGSLFDSDDKNKPNENGKGESAPDPLLTKLNEIHKDLLNGKIAVYIDKQKLNKAIINTARESGVNGYNSK